MSKYRDAYSYIMEHIENGTNKTFLEKKSSCEEYFNYCSSNNIKPLPYEDYSKIFIGAFPLIKMRRLGSRETSRSVYVGIKPKHAHHAHDGPNHADNKRSQEDQSTSHSPNYTHHADNKRSQEDQSTSDAPNNAHHADNKCSQEESTSHATNHAHHAAVDYNRSQVTRFQRLTKWLRKKML